MNEKQLEKLAVFSVIFMIVTGLCGAYINSCYSINIIDTINTETGIETENLSKSIQQVVAETARKIEENAETDVMQIESTEEIQKKLGKCYIKIKKSNQAMRNITLVDMYEQKKIAVLFHDTHLESKELNIDDSNISWVTEGREYIYDTDSREDSKTVQSVKVLHEQETDISNNGVLKKMMEIANAGRKQGRGEVDYTIELQLDAVYAYTLYADMDYIYVNLQPLKEVYDNIIVVDAGHGGKDTGSYAASGEETEKDFNLSIVKKLDGYLKQEEKIKVFYTRLTDKEVSLKDRVSMANSIEADLFLSVHCNSNAETPQANGMEVLYQNNGKAQDSSKKFAKIILKNLIQTTERRKRNILKGNDIYIIRNASMPVALAEVGFLNNISDLNFLQSEEGQAAIAKGLYNGILEMLSE